MIKIESDDDISRLEKFIMNEFSPDFFVSTEKMRPKFPVQRIFGWLMFAILVLYLCEYYPGLRIFFMIIFIPCSVYCAYKSNRTEKGVYDYFWMDDTRTKYTKRLASSILYEVHTKYTVDALISGLLICLLFVFNR